MDTARNELAAARAKLYGFFACVFRAEPTEKFIKEINSSGIPELLRNMGLSRKKDSTPVTTSSSLTEVEDLALEYTKLFIGPGPHLSPHESIYVNVDGGEGGLWGAKTVEVKKFVESAGFEYQSEFRGLPDHIGVELEFMQKLAETEAKLWSNGEDNRANWCLRIQQKFLDEHLTKWAPEFCDDVVEQAEMPFYAEFADAMKSFLEFDHEAISEQLLAAA